MLSIARAFQGIGPALLVPNAMALIGRTFPMGMKRNIVFSIFGAMGPTGWTTGAVFSALLAEKVWWPYCFFALTIACTLIAVFSFIIIPDSLAVGGGPPGSPPQKFDYVGTFTGVSGLILINFSLNQAPLVGWETPYTYFILIIGLLVTTFFVVVELHTDQPLIPIRSLQPSAAFALACIAAGWASHGIWIYYVNRFLMVLRGVSPLLTQAQTCLVAITGTMFALSTGFLLNHMHVSTLMFLAMTVFFVGTALVAFMPVHQTYWAQTFVSTLIMPGGMNWSFPAGTILLSNAMPKEMQGKAASLVSTVVNYSIATGLGFAGTVERSINNDGTKTLESFRGAWYLGMGMAGLGMVISSFFILTTLQEEKKARRRPSTRSSSVRRSHQSTRPVV
jgi:MFS family permease